LPSGPVSISVIPAKPVPIVTGDSSSSLSATRSLKGESFGSFEAALLFAFLQLRHIVAYQGQPLASHLDDLCRVRLEGLKVTAGQLERSRPKPSYILYS
jgi:hypothetical protein